MLAELAEGLRCVGQVAGRCAEDVRRSFGGATARSGWPVTGTAVRPGWPAVGATPHPGWPVAGGSRFALLLPVGLLGFSAFSGFPDRDIELLGIGAHRYFLFHSGAAIKALEWLYREWDRQGCRTPWERALKKAAGVALGGAAFGVGLHLFSDALHPKAVIFPLIGSLVGGTMVDDTLWLLGNALWCFKMGRDVILLAAGDDVAELTALLRARESGPVGAGA